MTPIEKTTPAKTAGFGCLRDVAHAWLLAEKTEAEQQRASLQAKIERLNDELAAITADDDDDKEEIRHEWRLC